MSKKVLVIDDDNDYVDSVNVLLSAKGYEVISAGDGTSGIEKAKSENPGLILLDVIMSTKNEGFDVAKTIQKEDALKNIPVIMVTGVKSKMSLPFDIEPCDECLPVRKVLEKPVKPEELLEIVEKYCK